MSTQWISITNLLEANLRQRILGQSKSKRHIIIDNWGKIEELVELVRSSLPINMRVELKDASRKGRNNQPVPFNPRLGNLTELPISSVAIAEVRISLLVDETFGWMIPVQFAIGPLLTATEIIEKVANTCFFLDAWSQAHSRKARVHVGIKHLKRSTTATPLIQ